WRGSSRPTSSGWAIVSSYWRHLRDAPDSWPRPVRRPGSCSRPTSTPCRRTSPRARTTSTCTVVGPATRRVSSPRSSRRRSGRAAIHVLLDALDDVRAIAWPTDEYFGDTTCNIGVIVGGTQANVIAPDARADLHIRLVTDQAPVRELLEGAVGSRARIEYLSFTPPVRLTAVPDFEQCVVGYTTDVPHLSNWGTPLLLGPGSIHD